MRERGEAEVCSIYLSIYLSISIYLSLSIYLSAENPPLDATPLCGVQLAPPMASGVELIDAEAERKGVDDPEADLPELMRDWYDEDKYLDFFVYQSVQRCGTSKELRKAYDKLHNSPADPPDLVVWLETLITTVALLFMQIAVPAVMCYRFISQLHDMYENDTRPERDVFNRMAGCAFMFGAMGILSSDLHNVGHTYFAQGKWNAIKYRDQRWMALGLLANIFSSLATELALFSSFMLTNELLDFVFNFAAFFVLYQVDSFVLSSDQKLEITRFVAKLKPKDMDWHQDELRPGLYTAVHIFMLVLYFTQAYVLRFAIPVVFAVLY